MAYQDCLLRVQQRSLVGEPGHLQAKQLLGMREGVKLRHFVSRI